MHMSDALISPEVAAVTITGAIVLLAVAIHKLKNTNNLPLMGVMGAFVFAAQMINFTIPGTGSSGHIVGGILLAAVLGPWGGFITLSSVLIIQCLLFADGGLLAIGCNIINLAAISCLVAYPLFFRSFLKPNASFGRILWVSILACVIGLELGAFAVTIETTMSGITALPFAQFWIMMAFIHLFIAIGEGFATAAVIYALQKNRASLLYYAREKEQLPKMKLSRTLIIIACISLVLAGGISWFASSQPDGLEWSILNITGNEELEPLDNTVVYQTAENMQSTTALMPDYNSSMAGIIGCIVLIIIAVVINTLIRSKKYKHEK